MVLTFQARVNAALAVLSPGLGSGRCHHRCRQKTLAGEQKGGPLGLAGIAKQLPFHGVEAVGRCKEPVAVGITNDNSRGLRTDFDDVGI